MFLVLKECLLITYIDIVKEKKQLSSNLNPESFYETQPLPAVGNDTEEINTFSTQNNTIF